MQSLTTVRLCRYEIQYKSVMELEICFANARKQQLENRRIFFFFIILKKYKYFVAISAIAI